MVDCYGSPKRVEASAIYIAKRNFVPNKDRKVRSIESVHGNCSVGERKKKKEIAEEEERAPELTNQAFMMFGLIQLERAAYKKLKMAKTTGDDNDGVRLMGKREFAEDQ